MPDPHNADHAALQARLATLLTQRGFTAHDLTTHALGVRITGYNLLARQLRHIPDLVFEAKGITHGIDIKTGPAKHQLIALELLPIFESPEGIVLAIQHASWSEPVIINPATIPPPDTMTLCMTPGEYRTTSMLAIRHAQEFWGDECPAYNINGKRDAYGLWTQKSILAAGIPLAAYLDQVTK